MLWDRHPELPFSVWAPWPRVDYLGHQDWSQAVDLVDSWLVGHVGHRWVDWTWGWATFKVNINSDICCVNFRRQRDSSLFLLRFSC
jgi:hypothetical protein